MYSLKEERISQLTPFSVLADNKRIRNKIIEGKSFQSTRSGKNLFDASKIRNSNIVVSDNGKTITMPTHTTGNGYTATNNFLKQLCPDLKVGDTVYLYGNTTSNLNKYIYIGSLWHYNTERTITQTDLDAEVILYGNRYSDGETGQVTITDISIMLKTETDISWEAFGASPSPEFPSEIQSVGDDVNLFNKVNVPEKDMNGLNWKYDNTTNKINISGVATSTYSQTTFINLEFKSGTYYFKAFGDTKLKYNMWFFNAENTIIGNTKLNNPVTITETATKIEIFVEGIVVGEEYLEIMDFKITKDIQPTSYSEYGKGTVEIKHSGKQLIPFTNQNFTLKGINYYVQEGNLYLNGTSAGETSSSDSNFKNNFLFMLDKGKYTLSHKTGIVAVYLRNENNEEIKIIGRDVGSSSFTLSEKTNVYIGFYQYQTSFENVNTEIMISKEDTETIEYEPYKGNNYVIPLSQPLRSLPNGVKDTIEEDGIHRRVGSVVLDGSENWQYQKSYDLTNTKQYVLLKSVSPKTLDVISNRFNTNKTGWSNLTTLDEEMLQIYLDGATYIRINNSRVSTVEGLKTWLSENNVEINYQLAEEVIEPFDEEQQAVINSMETFEGINHFSLVGDLETTLTFDYNPQITEEIKRAFKYNITKAYLEVAATDKASGFQINEDNYLQSIDFDDCRYIEGEGVIGSCVAKELQGKFVNVDTSFDIENREIECFIGAETEDNTTHYLRLGTFIVQKPENNNVKDNTSFDSLDYMIKFNKEYVHRMAKYFKTEDTDIIENKKYYVLDEGGAFEEVIVPNKEELHIYYEVIDEYTLMQLLKDICEQCEVKLGTFNFRNADYLVQGNRFDTGTTCRDVLKAIAQAAFSWARINEYNELLLDFETSDTIIEEIDYNEYYNLSFNDKYGPINTIVLKNSQAEGENITIKNDDLINSPVGKNIFTNLKWQEQTYAYFEINNEPYTLSLKLKEGQTIPTDLYLGFTKNGYYSSSQPIKWIIERGVFSSAVITDSSEFRYLNNVMETAILPYVSIFPTKYKDQLTEIFDIQLEKNNVFTGYEEPISLGPKELAISDNPFAYSEETRKAIIQAGEAIYGFKYVPLSVETIGAAYLNCKDKLKIKNMQDGDLETYVFDTRISYQGTIKSNVETLAMTDTETKYRYDGSLTTAQRRTEFRVDKAEQEISSLTKLTTEQGKKLTKATQDLEGFERIIEDTTGKTNDRLFKIEEDINGLVTSKTVSGGQNLIKNSVGYFGNDYWQINAETEGKVLTENSTDVKQNSISGSALKLQAETIYQDIKEIKNGEYYLSFNYKKIISAAIGTLKVNDLTIDLSEQSWKEEAHLINVTSNNIKIEMTTDLNSSILITDLMLTEGNLQVSWTQNANESYTDTVQIGKGVTITATGSKTKFVAEATGITIKNVQTENPVAEFTQYGTKTEELVVSKTIELEKSLLIQKIGNQIWFSSL